MTTAERAAGLASTARAFEPWLGRITADALLELVRAELGDAAMLDEFRPAGAKLTRAIAPRSILHVLSGNTPHAGLQTVLRGVLLGSHNFCKFPTGGLAEVSAFVAALPAGLASHVECSETLPEEWLRRADAIVVFGDDPTIAHFRGLARPEQIFCAHGHRVSFGIVLGDPAGAVEPAAKDASLFDQQGCLSPHGFFVRGDARAFAQALARAMADFNVRSPRRALSATEHARIRAIREDYRFRAANDDRCQVWMSGDGASTDWTVINDGATPGFIASPLDRVVWVKPLPADLASALAPVERHLGAVGYWPRQLEHARWIADQVPGASRICPMGEMQFPPLTWHQDGLPVLSSLVRWVDVEL